MNSIKNRIENCKIIQLEQILSGNGKLTSISNNMDIPFKVNRLFSIYDIPGGESRGAHAHKRCHQFLIAASGSFEVAIDDGYKKEIVKLNQPYYGLYISPGIWASEQNFSSGAICLVLTSHKFDKSDYIRNYQEYLKYIK